MSKETIQLKAEQVEELKAKVEKAKAVVLVDYRGLTVAEDTALRAAMRGAGVDYKVVKNRIIKRAFNAAGYTQLDEQLNGPTAVAISLEDAVAPAKILSDNLKKTNKTELKGGIVEGEVMDANGVKALAAIPAKPILLGQLLGMLTSPMRSLAVALSEIAKKKEA